MENYENGGRKPVLMVVVGRQRVGKTSFLNALAQYLQEHGAEFAIWDTDQMNTTNNISVFRTRASPLVRVRNALVPSASRISIRLAAVRPDVGRARKIVRSSWDTMEWSGAGSRSLAPMSATARVCGVTAR